MTNQPHVLIIGVGSIGERHLRCFRSTGRCTLALCEPMDDRRESVAQRYQVNGYRNWQDALSSENFTTAVIASPAPWHIPTAQALVEQGLDLLIEKPLSLNLEGIDQFVQAVERHKTRVAVGFNFRVLPALQHMRAAIQSGEFGSIVQIQVHAGQHFPFYRPAYREIYYADPEMGGGLIQDALPHYINAVEWIAGETTKVVVDAAHQVLPGVDVEDTVNLIARQGDIMTNYTVNQHQSVNEFSITVICQRGAVRWELSGQRWLVATENGGQWTEREAFVHQRDDYYIMQANAFFDYLSGKSEPLCPLADAITTLKSTLAVLRSRDSGRWECVDSLNRVPGQDHE